MAGFVPVTIAGRAFRKGPTSESGLVFCLLRFAGGFQWQTFREAHQCPGAPSPLLPLLQPEPSTGSLATVVLSASSW